MNYQLIPKELRPIAEKVEAQQRISEADALTLYGTNDLNALGMIANVVRERKNGNYATFIHNRYINYSNICILSCQFCAFAAKKRDAHAFEYAIDEIVQAVTDALPLGVTEVLVIDLALVGSGAETPLADVRALAAALPGVEIYAGGGVRDDADLHALETAGATGALVATALHEGRLTLPRS